MIVMGRGHDCDGVGALRPKRSEQHYDPTHGGNLDVTSVSTIAASCPLSLIQSDSHDSRASPCTGQFSMSVRLHGIQVPC